VKTAELTGLALDWAVAQCEGYTGLHKIAGRRPHEPQLGIWPPRKEYGVMDLWELSYSTDWAQGGPIIEREKLTLDLTDVLFDHDTDECVQLDKPEWWVSKDDVTGRGPTPLIAAMRCYVASKLGDDINIPEELI
jgi:hypothetical protein